jgi:hypothetical protein
LRGLNHEPHRARPKQSAKPTRPARARRPFSFQPSVN